ncbi:hypothetical protein BB559_007166 [Furculomyces boomerangus]|uniref:Maintenance of mitochondrial morphology protein 1 n=1 Tax=Furculomyces boomerangus TaxID=61424 RepID=A0A2T9XYM1_9FUNG|nr:hypothetical protein BB559_007166 [Furculomyces boomerangus]
MVEKSNLKRNVGYSSEKIYTTVRHNLFTDRLSKVTFHSIELFKAAIDTFRITIKPTFTQGFLLGQASVFFLTFYFMKSLFLESSTDYKARKVKESEEPIYKQLGIDSYFGGSGISKYIFSKKAPKEKKKNPTLEEIKKLAEEILAKTNYSLIETPFETTAWLTVFISQFYTKIRMDLEKHGWLSSVISDTLNGEYKPSVVDSIRITQLSLGSDFPRIIAAKMSPSNGSFGMMAELKLEFIDGLSLGFDTRIVLNWSKETLAALPVSMVLSVTKFLGTITLEIDHTNGPELIVSIRPDYELDINVQTLIGSQAKLQNLPMLTSLIIRKLRTAFHNELVHPNVKKISLKSAFGSKNNENAKESSDLSKKEPEKNFNQNQTKSPRVYDNPDIGVVNKSSNIGKGGLGDSQSPNNKIDGISSHFPFSKDVNINNVDARISTNHKANEKHKSNVIVPNENLYERGESIFSYMPNLHVNKESGAVEIPPWYNTQLPPQNSLNAGSSLRTNDIPSRFALNGYDSLNSKEFENASFNHQFNPRNTHTQRTNSEIEGNLSMYNSNYYKSANSSRKTGFAGVSEMYTDLVGTNKDEYNNYEKNKALHPQNPENQVYPTQNLYPNNQNFSNGLNNAKYYNAQNGYGNTDASRYLGERRETNGMDISRYANEADRNQNLSSEDTRLRESIKRRLNRVFKTVSEA